MRLGSALAHWPAHSLVLGYDAVQIFVRVLLHPHVASFEHGLEQVARLN